MKKVLIIQESLGGGGAEKVLNDILRGIDYKEYKIDLALIANNDDIYENKINKNVNIKNFFPKLKIENKLFKKIYNQIKIWHVKYSYLYLPRFLKDDYDIEIAFLEGPSTEILARRKNKNSKKIAWVHTDLTKLRRISFEKEKFAYSKMDKILAVSKEAKEKLLELYPENKDKVEVLYNLIDKDSVIKLGSEKLDYNLGENTLIAVGRLNKQKRFDKLIKVHKALLEDNIKNNLIILGEGEERSNLENLITELKVENTVKLLGFKENPYKYIKNSEIYVMSSEVEGFSLVVAEALILGKAVVSTNCTGPLEILGDSEYGIIVKEDTVKDLKNSIKELILNEEERKLLEVKAEKRSLIFDEKTFWSHFYSILNDV
ncbi:MAG: glycosyltransferase [Sarcina sp.]